MRCGELGGFFWIIDAIRLIDFTEYQLIDDSVVIGQITKGLFTYGNLRRMEFDKYNYLVNICREQIRKMNEGIK